MAKYSKNVGLQVFQMHFYDLTIAIQDPDTLAVRLYSKGIITGPVRDLVLLQSLSKPQKSNILVSAMDNRLRVEPSIFGVYIDILQSFCDRTLCPIARLLLQTKKGMELQSENVSPVSHTSRARTGEPNSTKLEISSIEEEFAIAMTDAIFKLHRHEDALPKMKVAMDHLKQLIPCKYNTATSVQEFFNLLSQYYSCLDCELVRILIRATNCQPAIDRFQKYLGYKARVSPKVSLIENKPSTDNHDDSAEGDTSESAEAASQDQLTPTASVAVNEQKASPKNKQGNADEVRGEMSQASQVQLATKSSVAGDKQQDNTHGVGERTNKPAEVAFQDQITPAATVAVDERESSIGDHQDDTREAREDTIDVGGQMSETPQDQPTPAASVAVIKQKPNTPEGDQRGPTSEEVGPETPPTLPSTAEALSTHPFPVATVTAIVNKDKFTVQDYEDTTNCLSNMWELPRLAFRYLSGEKGCIAIKWQIPSSLLPVIQRKQVSNEDYEYLASHSITELHVDSCYSLSVPTLEHLKAESKGTTTEEAAVSLSAPQTETELSESDSSISRIVDAFLLAMKEESNLKEVHRLLKSGPCVNETEATATVEAEVNVASPCAPYTETELQRSKRSIKWIVDAFLLAMNEESNLKEVHRPLKIGACTNEEAHLLAMSKEGNLKEVQHLIKSGVKVDCTDESGSTPLMWASLNGRLGVAKFLVGEGANVNFPDKEGGFLPLEVACQEGHLSTAEYLISQGANVNSQNEQGRSPLHAASENGHRSVVEVLIGAGASIDLQTKGGQSPLCTASRNGHATIVQKLLDADAKIDLQGKTGRSPLWTASFNGHSEVCQILLDAKADVNLKDEDGDTPLLVASHEGHSSIVQQLVDAGADVDSQRKDGMSPLWIASFDGHSEICQILLDAKADVNLKDKSGFSPLHVASQEGHSMVTQQLIDAGAAVNSQTMREVTPPMLACIDGHTPVIDILVKNGAQTDMRNVDGWSALWIASRYGQAEAARALVNSGADLNLPDQDGFTPMMTAVQNKNRDVIELLAGAHADLNIQEKASGRTALMLTAMEGDLVTVRLLLSAGADVSITDQNGSTAADIARAHGHEQVYQELVVNTKTPHTIPTQEQEVSTGTPTAPEESEIKETKPKAATEGALAEPTLAGTQTEMKPHSRPGEVKVETERAEVVRETEKHERIIQNSNYLQSLRKKMEEKLLQLLSKTGVIPRRKGTPGKDTTHETITTEGVILTKIDT